MEEKSSLMVTVLKLISLIQHQVNFLGSDQTFHRNFLMLHLKSHLMPNSSISIHHQSTLTMDNTSIWKCTQSILRIKANLGVSWQLPWVLCSMSKTTMRFLVPRNKISLIDSSTQCSGMMSQVHQ